MRSPPTLPPPKNLERALTPKLKHYQVAYQVRQISIHTSFICYCRSADLELQLKLTNCRVATVLEIREKSGKVKRG